MNLGPYVLRAESEPALLSANAGGKACNLARMTAAGFPVPEWFCISRVALDRFVEENGLAQLLAAATDSEEFEREVAERFLACPLPDAVRQELETALRTCGFGDGPVAVRSSGLDEDSAENSFAGQFSSFLFQTGADPICRALRLCWASAFSRRALAYRKERGLSLQGIGVGVVIQRMVDAERAGVAFSRHPIHVLARDEVLISAVLGAGEGLVSGALNADDYVCDRVQGSVVSRPANKIEMLVRSPDGGLRREPVPAERRESPVLSEGEVRAVARLAVALEEHFGCPQDCEWVMEKGELALVQTRPITNLPPSAFFDAKVNGSKANLWDNSNIIESYSGVTTPMTFSFASRAYLQVYLQFCELMGVPAAHMRVLAPSLRNQLGLVRGRIYYNLVSWYELVLALPGASGNKEFMETMMGVKQSAGGELEELFQSLRRGPRYSVFARCGLVLRTLQRFLAIDDIIEKFFAEFNRIHDESRAMDFRSMSLQELAAHYAYLDENLIRRWQAPIVNDYLCMLFFGILKKLTRAWVGERIDSASLQNDLLCGEGGLESTEPTRFLMRLAKTIDDGAADFRHWFLTSSIEDVLQSLRGPKRECETARRFEEFLARFGFRCVDELKLEALDLHDDPSFVIHSLRSFINTKSYHVEQMERREKEIRATAEAVVDTHVRGIRRVLFRFVLRQARKAVRNRENLRFARTKAFGLSRHLIRAMGAQLVRLGRLDVEGDVFYLTIEELLAFVEGRAVCADLRGTVEIRKREYHAWRQGPPPPDRFLTRGAVGMSFLHFNVLAEADLLRNSQDALAPDQLSGTPCCPGVVEGVVRVVHDLRDAEGLAGEILVTARTDPGWVPLFPCCSGLLVERGSLLSHSAVVARELGLPTIVGINGGLMQKLRTGDRVHMDAGRGLVCILSEKGDGRE